MPNSRSEGISYLSTQCHCPQTFYRCGKCFLRSELFTGDAQCAADLLQQPILAMEQQAFVINNLPAKAQEKGFAVLYPEECFNGGGDSDDGSNVEEEPSDSEDNGSECEEVN